MYRLVSSLNLLLWWLAVAMPLGAYAGDDTRSELVEVLRISEDISISSNHIGKEVSDIATLDNGLFRSQVDFDIKYAYSTWQHPHSSDRIQTSGDIAVRIIGGKCSCYDASPQANIRDANKAILNPFAQGDVGNELLKLTPPLFNGDQGKQFLFRQDFEQDYNTLMRILDDGIPGGKVAAWEKIKHSLDASIAAKATDVPFLQKFDDIVQNNNLGLDAEGLKAVLNAAALKGQKWDFPENILDAVKRASDGSISGMVVSHKKFPTAASGNSGGYLVPAKEYQKAASGDANLSFEVGGRSFDNVGADGKLVDRKFGHSNSIFDRVQNEFGEVDLVVHNPTRVKSLLTQAKGQLDAANGHPIGWEISTSTCKEGIESIFNGNFPQFLEDFPGVDFSVIEVVHVPL